MLLSRPDWPGAGGTNSKGDTESNMTGAMYAAISGLKAHMNKLNVIGNNIANVNTYGYKTQRAIFSDAIYTSLRTGSDGTSAEGAVNPSQIGYGVEMSSVDLDMSSGTFAPTGRDMDCMIMGDGFFMVGNKETQYFIDPTNSQTLTSMSLTRVGNFEFKADGYLSDANGNLVYGFLCTGNIGDTTTFSDQLVPIKLPRLISETDEETGITSLQIAYPRAGEGEYLAEATDEEGNLLPFAGMDSIAIDPSTGLITGTSKDTGMVVTIGVLAMANVTNPNGLTHMGGPYYQAAGGAGDIQVSLMGGVEKEMKICNNPLEEAELLDFTHVNASLSEEDAENLPDSMRIYSAGTTELMTGGLEMSKTDLATEISEMITTQRGYQANTRIITVTDAMLEELVNIKR